MSASARAQAMSAACDRVVVGYVRASAVQVSHALYSCTQCCLAKSDLACLIMHNTICLVYVMYNLLACMSLST